MNLRHVLALAAALAASQAFAAAPDAPRTGTHPNTTLTPLGAGLLSALASAPTVVMNTPLTFHFAGTGHCKLTLESGDGLVTAFEGVLPFAGTYTYSSTGMSSFEAFKNYTAHVTPTGNCKTSGIGPFTAKVQVVNPNPQSAGVPAKDNTVTLAGSGKLNVAIKPANGPAPVVPATITSILLASPSSAAPLSMPAGSATVLTVNGTGICKYRLSHVNLDAQGNTIMKSYPMVTMSSSAASPFPMGLSMLNNTPEGIYRWTAAGIEGCTGSASVTFSVQ